jgi:hypothetical protein
MRFRLRTLFVLIAMVAVLLTWFAWGVGWVREREALVGTPGIAFSTGEALATSALPLVWRLAGARPVRQILVHPSVSEEFIARLKAAYPEADLHRESSGRGNEAVR